METKQYNPSQLEIELAHGLTQLKVELEKYLSQNKITEIRSKENLDNPSVHILLEDTDGDKHELVIRIIQKVDKK